MPAGAGGSIVNVASINAFRSEDRYPLAGYVASKAGVVGLTRELAAQWVGADPGECDRSWLLSH